MQSVPDPNRVRLIWLIAGVVTGLLLGQVIGIGSRAKARDDSTGAPVETLSSTAVTAPVSAPVAPIRTSRPALLPHPNEASAEAIIDWVRRLPKDRFRDEVWEGILSGIALSDPKLALDTAVEISKNGGQGLVATLLRQVAEQNFDTALRWFQSLPEGDRKREVAGTLAGAWVTNDFAGADAMRLTLPPGYERQTFAEKIAEALARRDPNAALDWANALPDSAERAKALAAVAGPLGEQSPVAGMKLAMSLPDGPDPNAVRQILRRWVNTDLAGASAWASTLSDASSPAEAAIRNLAFQDIAGVAGLRDREAGMAWLDKLPPGESHDIAVASFVSGADGYDIALATQAAMTIQNPENRARVAGNVLSRWLREDANAARAWMDANSVPDAIRQAAQNPQNSFPGRRVGLGPRL